MKTNYYKAASAYTMFHHGITDNTALETIKNANKLLRVLRDNHILDIEKSIMAGREKKNKNLFAQEEKLKNAVFTVTPKPNQEECNALKSILNTIPSSVYKTTDTNTILLVEDFINDLT